MINHFKRKNIPIVFLVTCCDACKALAWVKRENEQDDCSSRLETILKNNYRSVAEKLSAGKIEVIPISAVKTVYATEDGKINRFPLARKNSPFAKSDGESSVGVDKVMQLILGSRQVKVPYEERPPFDGSSPAPEPITQPEPGNFLPGSKGPKGFVRETREGSFGNFTCENLFVNIIGLSVFALLAVLVYKVFFR